MLELSGYVVPSYLARTYLFDGDGKVSEFKLSVNGQLPITTGAAATTGDTILVTAAYECARGSNPLVSGCDLRTRWLIQAADGTVLLDDTSPPSGTAPVPVSQPGVAAAEGTKSFVMPAQDVTVSFTIVQLKGGFASENVVDSRSMTISWLPTQKAAQQIQGNLVNAQTQQDFQSFLNSISPYVPWLLAGGAILVGLAIVVPAFTKKEHRHEHAED